MNTWCGFRMFAVAVFGWWVMDSFVWGCAGAFAIFAIDFLINRL